jgi:hypothetical protein
MMVVINDFPDLISIGFWGKLDPTYSQPGCICFDCPFRTKFTGRWEHNNTRSKLVVGKTTKEPRRNHGKGSVVFGNLTPEFFILKCTAWYRW